MECKILYAGSLGGDQLAKVRFDTLCELHGSVIPFDYGPTYRTIANSISRRILRRIHRRSVYRKLNRDLVQACLETRPDVLYVDKGTELEREALVRIREDARSDGRDICLLHFHPDHAFHPLLITRAYSESMKEYDCHFCPHSWVVDDHLQRGAKRVRFMPFGFDPRTHYRVEPAGAANEEHDLDAVFVGRWEKRRAGWIMDLARSGVRVHVWGWPREDFGCANLVWRGPFADFTQQREAFGRARLSLGMLSDTNLDGHTARTFEIPACGGFMLGQRSSGQTGFFAEGVEMACFDSSRELLEQAHYYLDNPEERETIREAGYRKCLNSGYDYESRMALVAEEIAHFRSLEPPGGRDARGCA